MIYNYYICYKLNVQYYNSIYITVTIRYRPLLQESQTLIDL